MTVTYVGSSYCSAWFKKSDHIRLLATKNGTFTFSQQDRGYYSFCENEWACEAFNFLFLITTFSSVDKRLFSLEGFFVRVGEVMNEWEELRWMETVRFVVCEVFLHVPQHVRNDQQERL